MSRIFKIVLFLLSYFFVVFSASAINNDTISSSNGGYNAPIYFEGLDFTADYKDDGFVYMNWAKFYKDEELKYYKLIRSQTVSDPVYPDNGYIFYSSDIEKTSYVDKQPFSGYSYYRVCAITNSNNRYCSNVAKINVVKNTKSENQIMCTMEYAPVCGKKEGILKTYSNMCMMNAAKATKMYVGECESNMIVGNDKDKHGCIASAGYTWCEVKNKCIRTWEEKCEKPQDIKSNNSYEYYKKIYKEKLDTLLKQLSDEKLMKVLEKVEILLKKYEVGSTKYNQLFAIKLLIKDNLESNEFNIDEIRGLFE